MTSIKTSIILLIVTFLFTKCELIQGHSYKEKIERDTTINPQNAYSKLFLDSVEVENFISQETNSDSIAQKIKNFYNLRNYAFAWFDEDGLTVQGEGFWNAHNQNKSLHMDSSTYHMELHRLINKLPENGYYKDLKKDSLNQAELRLTQHFFEYVKFVYEGKVDPEEMQWHIPRRKVNAVVLLDSLLKNKRNDEADWQPLNRSFHLMQDALLRYYAIEKNGGWDTIATTGKKFKEGTENKLIKEVKRRLYLSGDFKEEDTSAIYTKTLKVAVTKVEKGFGLNEDGVIDDKLIQLLNVPVKKRLETMLVNLERMKWMPEQSNNFIVANIPEYRLHVYENNKEVLNMDIVVGKAANRTVIFSDELKYVVFSPYWNIPKSIVQNEILPSMQKNSNYLNRNNMEITGYNNGLPVVRQKPGNSNSLGLVKFIFPNQYNIYFHDTPAKSLFQRDKRAFSHGCIRLHKPFEFAKYLLRDNSTWTDEKIREAMHSDKEKWVTLKSSVPVFITYFTSWVGEDGTVFFRDDVYNHDVKMKEHLLL